MPRQPKPYYRKQTKSWYCSIAGRQISLGKDRTRAFEKFHELMADRSQVKSEFLTLYELTQAYLDWCEANRKPTTYTLHRHYLKKFIEHVGKRLRPSQLRIHQVARWHEGLGVDQNRPLFLYRSYEDQYAAVRIGKWKLIAYRSEKIKLFDLAADPFETADLSASHRKRSGEMLAILRDWEQEIGIALSSPE